MRGDLTAVYLPPLGTTSVLDSQHEQSPTCGNRPFRAAPTFSRLVLLTKKLEKPGRIGAHLVACDDFGTAPVDDESIEEMSRGRSKGFGRLTR